LIIASISKPRWKFHREDDARRSHTQAAGESISIHQLYIALAQFIAGIRAWQMIDVETVCPSCLS